MNCRRTRSSVGAICRATSTCRRFAHILLRYLLDTNVISEPFKRSPEAKVINWFASQSPLDLCISVLTLGELTMGFELAPGGKRRIEL